MVRCRWGSAPLQTRKRTGPGSHEERENSFPDFIFSKGPPDEEVENGGRTFVVGDVKLGVRNIRPGGNQFRRMVAHARSYAWAPINIYLTLQGGTAAQRARLQAAAAPIRLVFVSAID